jgi:hypothetical protein
MITVQRELHVQKENRGRKRLSREPSALDTVEPGRVPRISKLMAIAIVMNDMVAQGEVKDLSQLARITGVSQPRATQIMNLTLLAPDIQETLLFLPRVVGGKDPVTEKELRPVVAEVEWGRQREVVSITA